MEVAAHATVRGNHETSVSASTRKDGPFNKLILQPEGADGKPAKQGWFPSQPPARTQALSCFPNSGCRAPGTQFCVPLG